MFKDVKEMKRKGREDQFFSMCINSTPTHPHICTPGDLNGKGFRVRPSSIISSARTQENKCCHVYIVEKIVLTKSTKFFAYITGPRNVVIFYNMKSKKKKDIKNEPQNEDFELYSDKAEIDNVFHIEIRNVVKYGISLNHHMGRKECWPRLTT